MSGPNDGSDLLDPGAPQAASQMEAWSSSPVYHLWYTWCPQGALEVLQWNVHLRFEV